MTSCHCSRVSTALLTTIILVCGAAGAPDPAADRDPLPTYSSITNRFPTTALLRPPDVIRFRSTQLMYSLWVDQQQLDAMLNQAGWASINLHYMEARRAKIQVFWDFSCREQYPGLGYLPEIDPETTCGPGDAFYLGTTAVSLTDPTDRRYLILMWVAGNTEAVDRLNAVYGGGDATIAYKGNFEMTLHSKSAIGSMGVRSVEARVSEPISGLSFGLAAVLPNSVAMVQAIDDPMALPVTWLDTSAGISGRTSIWSEQSGYQRFFIGMTPGFFMKVPVGGSLHFPGGWTVDLKKWDDTLHVYTDVEGHGKLID